ncbi:MAG: hypothetical protein Q8P68_03555 [Candidatus Peregrinibacteria bacterium]|nr:hypothetical protein [Candidatus Peregrinibacteria bacterium]MDZ4245323.1 hypothetical protein [Candidatus Gracilibacteria bacterium]
MNDLQNINKEFTRLLSTSVMSADDKESILKKMEGNAMDQEEFANLYLYLVSEEEVRKANLPNAMIKLGHLQGKMIASEVKQFRNRN